jgi:AraC-like DNA-binding protein
MLMQYNFKPYLVKRLVSIGHKGKKRGFLRISHTHPKNNHEMIFIDYGRIKLTIEKNTSTIKPGECIFIPGGATHSLEGYEGAPFDYLNVMFYGKLPKYILGKGIPVSRKCFDMLNKLKEESVGKQLFGNEIMASCMTELIATLARQINVPPLKNTPESANFKKYRSAFVNRALKVISQEYQNPLNLNILCKSTGIGKSRLKQLIKDETGESFSTILHKQRVLAAKHLISEGIYSLQQISVAVGYGYPSFFFRIFKRVTGMTPGAYAASLGEPQMKE